MSLAPNPPEGICGVLRCGENGSAMVQVALAQGGK
jgi:hypothetical protein